MRTMLSVAFLAVVSCLMGCCHDTCDTCRDICNNCNGGGNVVHLKAAPAPAQPMPAPVEKK